ncbi:hypothetical protein DFJ73DRAFT_4169 [Zopfochytrium polystomum]|nr:hypothetical protein DFJ73DRAFT_4169 [Zopfochytrium polystomum]
MISRLLAARRSKYHFSLYVLIITLCLQIVGPLFAHSVSTCFPPCRLLISFVRRGSFHELSDKQNTDGLYHPDYLPLRRIGTPRDKRLPRSLRRRLALLRPDLHLARSHSAPRKAPTARDGGTHTPLPASVPCRLQWRGRSSGDSGRGGRPRKSVVAMWIRRRGEWRGCRALKASWNDGRQWGKQQRGGFGGHWWRRWSWCCRRQRRRQRRGGRGWRLQWRRWTRPGGRRRRSRS